MKKIDLYTDGSCLGNPGPGGWAFVIVKNKKIQGEKSGGVPEATNNRMEMTAVTEALKWSLHSNYDEISIWSDSRLVLSTITKGWKKKKNQDLWSELESALAALSHKKIEWHWVKGHHLNKFNNRADIVAVQESKKFKTPQKNKSEKSDKEEFFCPKCKKVVEPKLLHLEKNNMVKAVCKECEAYLKFVKPTKEALKKAQKVIKQGNLFD